MFKLAIDGDECEKKAYDLFLRDKFPSYEAFWSNFVVELTNRPNDVHLKSDVDLGTIFQRESVKQLHQRVAISQLHYSVLRMLLKAWKCMEKSERDVSEVENFFSSIYSAIDISAELFNRFYDMKEGVCDGPDPFDPQSCESDSLRRRKNWQKNHDYPEDVQELRTYRNLMHHGQAFGSLITPQAGNIALPKPAEVKKYLDWRNVGASWESSGIRDFLYAKDIVKDAFDCVLSFLETEWRKHLLS